jgi:hypothetical protein
MNHPGSDCQASVVLRSFQDIEKKFPGQRYSGVINGMAKARPRHRRRGHARRFEHGLRIRHRLKRHNIVRLAPGGHGEHAPVDVNVDFGNPFGPRLPSISFDRW